MIRASVLAALAVRGPMTIDELEEALGIPRATLHSALTEEVYDEREVVHKDYGKVTAWVPSSTTLLRIDGDGRYYLGRNPT